ncbi:MAG TPA: choice-of-anchor Q domain-containing protein [Solirubrobacterales bacterium]|nr:choice-of-anchor Q domain-containing protein [Solirubrobacterales bacterium]
MRRLLPTVCLGAVAMLAMASTASAATFRPTRTDDPVPNGCKPKDCSLREAVIAANASGMPATILLRPGRRYELTRAGPGEDAAATGDLDLTSDMAVKTRGFPPPKKRHRRAKMAIIDGNDNDRIFDVYGPGLRLDWIVARDGHARQSAGDDGDGGAVRGGFLKLHHSRLVSNVAAGNGGAFASPASPVNFAMKAALLEGNIAAGNGGAVYVSGSPGVFRGGINSVRAVHNSAGGSGGAIFGTWLSIDHATVADNQSGADGGGIAFSGTGSNFVAWSTVSGNRAASSGGGIHTTVASTASATAAGVEGVGIGTSTIANNRAGGNGGGIGASGANSTTELGADTVARNVAGPGHVGGGLYQGSGDAIRVQSTIVALNLAGAGGSDCLAASSGFDSMGHNLIGNAGGCFGFGAAGDLFGGRLALGKLADNGGAKPAGRDRLGGITYWAYGRPVKTIALGRGSRAIDHGLRISGTDERGVKRGRKPDIGAYERVVKSYRLINAPRRVRCTRTDPICAK